MHLGERLYVIAQAAYQLALLTNNSTINTEALLALLVAALTAFASVSMIVQSCQVVDFAIAQLAGRSCAGPQVISFCFQF